MKKKLLCLAFVGFFVAHTAEEASWLGFGQKKPTERSFWTSKVILNLQNLNDLVIYLKDQNVNGKNGRHF